MTQAACQGALEDCLPATDTKQHHDAHAFAGVILTFDSKTPPIIEGGSEENYVGHYLKVTLTLPSRLSACFMLSSKCSLLDRLSQEETSADARTSLCVGTPRSAFNITNVIFCRASNRNTVHPKNSRLQDVFYA